MELLVRFILLLMIFPRARYLVLVKSVQEDAMRTRGWLSEYEKLDQDAYPLPFIRELLQSYHKFNLSLASNLYQKQGWGPYTGYPLSDFMLARTSFYNGTLTLMIPLLDKLIRSNRLCDLDDNRPNEIVTILLTGGSVTIGRCCFTPCFPGNSHKVNWKKKLLEIEKANEPCQTRWMDLLLHSLKLAHPCVDFRLYEATRRGSHMDMTQDEIIRIMDEELEGKLDLFLIDYGVNDGTHLHLKQAKLAHNMDDVLKAHEYVIRFMLDRNSPPAILYLENPTNSLKFDYKTPQLHATVAKHYDVPIISYLAAVWPKREAPLWDWNHSGRWSSALEPPDREWLMQMSPSDLSKGCQVCRFYWSNWLTDCHIHPAWYTHQLVADTVLANILRWQMTALDTETERLPYQDAEPYVVPRYLFDDVQVLKSARCGKAAADLHFDALQLYDQNQKYRKLTAPQNKVLAERYRSLNKHQSQHKVQKKKRVGFQKQEPVSFSKHMNVEANSAWSLTEDVPGKPGWIVEGEAALGSCISFPVACPGSTSLAFLQSYEKLGNARVFFSKRPLSAGPILSTHTYNGMSTRDMDAGIPKALVLEGLVHSAASQAKVVQLFCTPPPVNSSSSPPLDYRQSSQIFRTTPEGSDLASVSLRESYYLTVEFSEWLNANNTSFAPKFKVLAVSSWSCSQPALVMSGVLGDTQGMKKLQEVHDLVSPPVP